MFVVAEKISNLISIGTICLVKSSPYKNTLRSEVCGLSRVAELNFVSITKEIPFTSIVLGWRQKSQRQIQPKLSFFLVIWVN